VLRFRPVLVAISLVALLTGCTVDTGGPVADDTVGAITPGFGQDCDTYAPGRTAPPTPDFTPLPADSVLVSATRCTFQTANLPGDGNWFIRTDQRADSGLDALAAALRLPSQDAPAGLACAAIGYSPIVITVTDTRGRQIKPLLPHDDCGGALPRVTAAIAAVPWQTVATHQVQQTESQVAVDSGCPDLYKPVIALQAAIGSGPRQSLSFPTDAAALQMCRYVLDPDPVDNMSLGPNGSDGVAQGGRLADVTYLNTSTARSFLAAVAVAPPVAGCTRPPAPFALIGTPAVNAALVTVELGGCYRALVGSELRQLDSTTVSKLTS
jgi:hypothetical protein